LRLTAHSAPNAAQEAPSPGAPTSLLTVRLHLSPLLQALVDYVVLHFKTEEDGFSAHHYAHEVEHKAIHQKFLADVTAAIGGGINPAIIDFLKNWLVTHIKGEFRVFRVSTSNATCVFATFLDPLLNQPVLCAGSDMKYKGVL
jgi:hypothetical protein